jgi:hypothetical protein
VATKKKARKGGSKGKSAKGGSKGKGKAKAKSMAKSNSKKPKISISAKKGLDGTPVTSGGEG